MNYQSIWNWLRPNLCKWVQQSWKYSNLWYTFYRIAVAEYPNLTTTCLYGSHWLPVHTAHHEVVLGCITWLAPKLTTDIHLLYSLPRDPQKGTSTLNWATVDYPPIYTYNCSSFWACLLQVVHSDRELFHLHVLNLSIFSAFSSQHVFDQ